MTKIRIEMCNKKTMDFELYEDIAPKTVANFLDLVDNHFYDYTVFHRVINGFMSQAGGMYIEEQKLIEKPCDRNVVGEFLANGIENKLHHELGVLSMARASDFNSASSQFFICDVNCGYLDSDYAAFGKIVEDFNSLKTLVEINSIRTISLGSGFENFPEAPIDDITIKSIYRI